ncbi:methylated-DNA--[protein]-cysteine S-methyltransferase [Vandammella animalimorsus]|uniref:Methylated-DNA--protein-cysteine methyltransferase n=1 Tax=Vandammella animalimorsus TaxID=2029117 RepID=A0A2A2A8P8_9BURK|nr:methylated-DNA--[protein]-cysteine S-methyltransferase [Vandammella animalimorsus]PAT34147.1 cysteine methyltransferase [Vandammella animalimorsus]
MTIFHQTIDSPVGRLLIAASDEGLHAIEFPQGRHPVKRDANWQESRQESPHPLLSEAARQLGEYFAGQRRVFDLPLAPQGTDFQQRVWQALRTIPYGQTRSYAQLAAAIGQPKAMRAVGAANGRNPLSIVVPCHRVIGADGTLVGFGGGLPVKTFLLRLEGALA